MLLIFGSVGVTPRVHADPDPNLRNHDPIFNEDRYAEFYTPPDPLPAGAPGDLIRTELSRLVLEPSGQLGAIMATGTRIMYRSADSRGNPMAVTGTYFEPENDWSGKGPRPLIVYGPGAQGQGTPGLHTYVNRVAEGNAMLDAGRAALRLPGTSLDRHGPVAFWGYSQGGGAAASAAELAASYAPDLRVVGTYAGAPPADLKQLFPYADGSALVGVVGHAVNGVLLAYPEAAQAIHDKLTPRGEDLFNKVAGQCIAETITKFMFRHLQPYFTEDIHQLVNEEPFSGLFDPQKIGRYKPNAPVLINSNRYDPLVPWTAANQLGRDWCDQGADVEFRTNEEPPFLNKTSTNHALPMFVDGEPAMQWIAARFNGEPSTPNCGEF